MKFKNLVTAFIPFCLFGMSISLLPVTNAQVSGGFYSPRRFDFALIGDIPYDPRQEVEYEKLIREINKSRVRFVIHDGDFKSGSSLCSDELFAERLESFQQFRYPLIYIFGDNEWTDCHRAAAGGFDPLERLEKLRSMFTSGNRSFGRTSIPLTRQSQNPGFTKFRENVYWTHGNVFFTGIHVIGSNNNLGRNAENDLEYAERNGANLAWLQESFALARENNNLGMVIVIHANPDDFNVPADAENNGFKDFINALKAQLEDYTRPVMLVHGDSHYFRIDKPLNNSAGRVITNFTRVETFGSPNVHWLRVTVDPRNPNLLEINQEILGD